jgi:hypothetical protein
VEAVDPTSGVSTSVEAPPEAPTAPASASGSKRVPIVVGVAAVLIGLGLLGHQFLSTTAYEQSWSRLTVAEGQLTETIDAYERVLDRSNSAAARADALHAVVGGDLVTPEVVEELRADAAELRSALESAPAPTGPLTGRFEDPAEFAPAWDRYADVIAMAHAIPARDAAIDEIDGAASAVSDARRAVLESTDAVFAVAFERAAAELDAHPQATYRSTLDVRHLIGGADVDGQSMSASGFTRLADAVTTVRASHAEVEAAREAHPVRAEIEAFARSIAQGVILDFAWAYEVAGVQSDGWFAGTAEFWPEDGGWGLITLSHSIDDAWGDENAEAVVVHEVGHTQAIRESCAPIFEGPEFRRDHEMWATAWAIGRGYDLPGSGIEAYGRPSDAQIAAAAQCR